MRVLVDRLHRAFQNLIAQNSPAWRKLAMKKGLLAGLGNRPASHWLSEGPWSPWSPRRPETDRLFFITAFCSSSDFHFLIKSPDPCRRSHPRPPMDADTESSQRPRCRTFRQCAFRNNEENTEYHVNRPASSIDICRIRWTKLAGWLRGEMEGCAGRFTG